MKTKEELEGEIIRAAVLLRKAWLRNGSKDILHLMGLVAEYEKLKEKK
jgi:hypothetical protein